MKKSTLLTLLCALLCLPALRAQIVTTEPSPLQEDSQNVVVYYHTDEGNRGLLGAKPPVQIYAHTGVCVEGPDGTVTDWKYAPTWGDNDPKYELEYVSTDLWKLNIGDLRTYYGVASDETIKKLCFVFRNADNSQEGKGEGNSDIFVDVLDAGFQLSFRQSRASNIVNAETPAIKFTAQTTEPADIKIYVADQLIGEGSAVDKLQATYKFEAEGNYLCRAVATKGSKTLTESLMMVYASDSRPGTGELPPAGVTKNPDGSYTFCIAAPEKRSVMLVGSWNAYQPDNNNVMAYLDRYLDGGEFRYFTITLPASVTGSEFGYYYLIDGKTAVGDPYARLILDPSNDKYISAEVYPDMPAYPDGKVPAQTAVAWYADNLLDYSWSNTAFTAPDKTDLVIYELLIRDFTGTEGAAKGNGTVRGVIDKIPYLQELGINAVELLPINEFNGNNSWGYNPNFYFAVDKAYGSPQDYKELIDKCHEAGIAVILDIVFNQCDWLHPWYKMYDTGSNPFINASAPHAFSVLNDWNQGYPLVQQQWRDCLQFWLSEYKVDGFRFDLVKGLGDNDSYANNGSSATSAYNASRVARMKDLHNAMRQVNPDAYFINENLATAREENEMAEDGEMNWANVNNAGCQFAMAYSSDANLNRVWALKDSRTAGSTVAYLESHDEYRMGYKQITWGIKAVKEDERVRMQRLGSAAAQLILAPGAHMIWMFGELGDSQNSKSSSGDNLTSPKIVDWGALENPERYALFQNYCSLINLRTSYPELFDDDNFTIGYSAWAPGRSCAAVSGDKELYLVVNPNYNKEVEVAVPFLQDSNEHYWIQARSAVSNPTFSAAAKTVTVEPNCFAVITSRNLTSGVDNLEYEPGFEAPVAVALQGAIRVNAADTARVEIYTLAGARVATGSGQGTYKVAPGAYIVRAGRTAAKLIVR